MHIRTAAATVAAALLLAGLTACGSSDADPAACKAAMSEQFKTAMADGANAKPAGKPDACDGIDDATLRTITSDLMKDAIGDIKIPEMPTMPDVPEMPTMPEIPEMPTMPEVP